MPSPADYPHQLALPTRWHDNDVYGHVNNVDYYAFFDTVINEWLIREGGLDIHRGAAIGLCAESHCAFKGPLAFPETVTAGLRVGKLGNSSVRYEIGLFGEDGSAAAEGWAGAGAGVLEHPATSRAAPITSGLINTGRRITGES